ncbi:O-antigen polymerase [Marinifilum flexuosum]|uniref:Oligosaccharide repeat unit polymerase n=1 Tax=Marinifilum flexuosum TaxID=1117708 RepID=A0A419XA38_9BACT|nr:O-antigen polymerase [Marinifilum flexuosum]RKE04602.1 oligosaccharide repeat unit polymerase [Marinifilum flexuosum]
MKRSVTSLNTILLGILAIVSLVMFFIAPDEYSYSFGISCVIIYVLENVILLRNNCKLSLINFEFFFFVAYSFTFYVYPIFHYSVNPYFLLFSLPFNESYISSGIALANVGYSFYALGIYDSKRKFLPDLVLDYKTLKDCSLLLCVLLGMYIPRLIQLVIIGVPTKEFESSLINVLIQYVLYYVVIVKVNNFVLNYSRKGIFLFIRKNWLVFTMIFVYLFLLILLGSRTIPLRILLLLLLLYNIYLYKLSKKVVVLLIIFGSVALFAIGVIRNPSVALETSTMQVNPILKVGNELVINNRSLYVLMEQKDLYGINFGQTLLMYILSVIPFMQSIFLYITGWSVSDISSAALVTELYFGDKPDKEVVGLGTNIIGDIYLSFGIIGVILLMFFGGILLKKLYRSVFLKNNIIPIILYSVLFMDVIYITRSSYLVSLRGLVWIVLLYLILNKVKQFKVKSVTFK